MVPKPGFQIPCLSWGEADRISMASPYGSQFDGNVTLLHDIVEFLQLHKLEMC